MKKHHIILILIIIFAGILWNVRLGNLPLWEDEAHTALFGKSVLEHGLPKVWDGKNLISGVQAEDFNKDFVLTWDQPLQFYATALSIKVFGLSNWSARLPFVLAGLISILLLYLFVQRFTENRNVALLSAFLFAISVIFILHARQCRYYSLGTMSVLLLYLSYIDFGKKGYAGFTYPLSLVLLFYSNLLMLATALGSLILYHVICDFSWKRFRGLFLYSLFSLPFVVPWFVYARLWEKQGPHVEASLTSKFLNIFEMFFKFNRAFFPLLILLIVIYLVFRNKMYFNKKFYRFLLIIIVFPLHMVPILLLPGIRYMIYLAPFCAFLTALITAEIYRRKKWLAVIFLFLIVFTKIFSNFGIIIPQWLMAVSGADLMAIKTGVAEKLSIDQTRLDEAFKKADTRIKNSTTPGGIGDSLLKMEYAGYLYDITHDYSEPITGVVEFLKKNARPGDRVMIMLDAFPLMLYAPEFGYAYIVEKTEKNKEMLQNFPEYIYSYDDVGWFIPRDLKKIKGPFISEDEFIAHLKKNGVRYKKHTIDYQNFYWDGARPESFSKYAIQHSGRSVGDDRVVIYEITGQR